MLYNRVGDIYALAPIFATLYAIVSKAQTYNFVEPAESEETKTENTQNTPEKFSRDRVSQHLQEQQ